MFSELGVLLVCVCVVLAPFALAIVFAPVIMAIDGYKKKGRAGIVDGAKQGLFVWGLLFAVVWVLGGILR